MIRPACLTLAVLMLAPAAQAQTRPDYDRLKHAWGACVRQSFAVQRQQMPDGALAVENAFTACTTEEEAIYAAGPLAPDVERRGRIYLRGLLKGDLLRAR
ncbi:MULTISPECIES: hypothetical protein [Methylorubrum]|uniref:hypothetical protein n=1 Tax=Methylorubrum TaxID=2282523 RepID=UPI0020A1B838|nr:MULTISPECIES: hypothetical protein [Methylorubrum]MCP1551652.1 creatinine amidohydrolase/Fe(II)-dependent formamide hydrolase-like protein [Methylorubrum zatmanii]MCP1556580.1 creatinine amidohydrolase/Fe(II)-dependent formamide hydrolase-like protein [Methylorubrum extorquens]MCP1581987.1 creatinine amidohydrolase/Fe(II)-dependent formamide hydrolase-like protein [Methylorubrum extorquens]